MRRLETIAADRKKWVERAGNATATSSRCGRGARKKPPRKPPNSRTRPNEIELRRRALMTQLSEAETLRRRPPIAWRKPRTGRSRPTRPPPTRCRHCPSRARRGCGRKNVSWPRRAAQGDRGAHPRGAERAPASRCSSTPASIRTSPCRTWARLERKLERLKDRARTAGRRQSARRGGAAGAVGASRGDHLGARGHHRGDPQAAWRDPEPEPGRPRAPAGGVRDRQRPLPATVRASLRRRHGAVAADRIRRPAGCRAGDPRPPARQASPDHDPAVGRRAGADGHGADLRGLPDQPGADLRAGRGGRAARRPQCRALLQSDGRDGGDDRHALSSSSPTIRSPWRG